MELRDKLVMLRNAQYHLLAISQDKLDFGCEDCGKGSVMVEALVIFHTYWGEGYIKGQGPDWPTWLA